MIALDQHLGCLEKRWYVHQRQTNQAFDFHIPNFKTMTTSNNDYISELLDQELSSADLVGLSGAKGFSYKHESFVVTDSNGRKIVLKDRNEFKGDKEYEKYFKSLLKR
ncbi:MAG: hypothetical protein AB8B34_01865 [Prochlorococcus sp.]